MTAARGARRTTSDAPQRATEPFGWPPILVMRLATVYTGRSSWTLKRAVRVGRLVAAGKCGRSLVFRREDLERWMLGPVADQAAGAAVTRDVKPSKRSPAAVGADDVAIARLRRLARDGAR